MARENWNHAGDRTGRFRGGKTRLEHATGHGGSGLPIVKRALHGRRIAMRPNATFPGGH